MDRNDLYEYQNYSVGFLKEHPEALLILEMGLGKTIITLSAIQYLMSKGEVHKTLVIAPLRVCQKVWPEEVKDWLFDEEAAARLIKEKPMPPLEHRIDYEQLSFGFQ